MINYIGKWQQVVFKTERKSKNESCSPSPKLTSETHETYKISDRKQRDKYVCEFTHLIKQTDTISSLRSELLYNKEQSKLVDKQAKVIASLRTDLYNERERIRRLAVYESAYKSISSKIIDKNEVIEYLQHQVMHTRVLINRISI
jgi:hypothetical protein